MKKSKSNSDFFRYIRYFLTVYLPRSKCYSSNTVKSYKETINLLRLFLLKDRNIKFTNISFNIINHNLIYEFLEWLKTNRNCSTSTVNQRLATIKSFLHYCSMEDSTLTAIYLDIQQISAQKKAERVGVVYMTKTALKAILAQPDATTKVGLRNRFFMILMYDTGARMQEMLDLKLKDIFLEADMPCIYLTGKGNKTRAVPLMDETILHLKEYIKHFHSDYDRESPLLHGHSWG